MDFAEPISYPLKDLKKIIIGGLLFFPGIIFFFIPVIIAMGYTIKVAGDTVMGRDEFPEFDNWRDLFMKGLGCILICIFYVFILVIAFAPRLILFLALIFNSVNEIVRNIINHSLRNMSLILYRWR